MLYIALLSSWLYIALLSSWLYIALLSSWLFSIFEEFFRDILGTFKKLHYIIIRHNFEFLIQKFIHFSQ
ncbi:MAG: hypothetical protein CMJ41_10595, partial [Phycisphaerae bacterium]|nr:hypothetical protein [Phycisphaerae bacterium]